MNAMTTEDRTRADLPREEPPGRGHRRRPFLAGALVIALIVAVTTVVLWPTDDESSTPDDGATPTTQPAARTTSPTTAIPPAEPADVTAMWPYPGSSMRFATPEDAAHSFATDFLRFEAPMLEAFQAGDNRSGEIRLRPAERGPVTTILLRQVGAGDDWSVLGAVSDNIEVTEPAAFTEITSPVRVAGHAVAFEGTVQVEVRADGATGAIGAGFVTGGGDVPRPFEGTVVFETSPSPYGALVFFAESAENGQVWEAAAFRVSFRSTDIDAAACGDYRGCCRYPGRWRSRRMPPVTPKTAPSVPSTGSSPNLLGSCTRPSARC